MLMRNVAYWLNIHKLTITNSCLIARYNLITIIKYTYDVSYTHCVYMQVTIVTILI